jgi:hypothetical protein
MMEGPSHLSTHLVLPAWWVRAHDAAGRAETRGDGAMAQAVAARLAPALSVVELAALASVLAQLQVALLAGATGALQLSLGGHLKHAGQSMRARRFAYERLLQELAGLRIVLPDATGGAWRTQALFAAEAWRLSDGDDLVVDLTPTAAGADLLLGACDLHVELLRRTEGLPEVRPALGREAPLAVWRSVWLDLAGPELELFLRIERAMQWEQRWLDLDGSFSIPLAALTEEFGRTGDFAARLRQLARLGRRLAMHGLLVPRFDGRFLAFGDEAEDGPLVVWQAGRERLVSDAGRRHVVAVSEWNRRFRLQPQAGALAQVFVAPDADQAVAEALAREVLALPAPEDAVWALWDASSGLLAPQMIFLELALRTRARGVLALPDAAMAGPFAALADPAAAESVAARFAAFCTALAGEPEFARNLRTVPLATLASEVSREHVQPIWQNRASATAVPAAPRGEAKPRLVPVAMPAAGSVAAATASAAGEGDHFASRMRKTASDELARLRAGDPAKYAALKRAYFESLDDGARRMMLDVQRQLEPTKFEEQLRPQLVRFMVEHPGAWRSSPSPQGRAPAGPTP